VSEKLAALFSGSPHILVTVILAMAPVSELRGAIPYAIAVGHMSWQEALAISVVANFIPVIPALYLIGPLSAYLMRWRLFHRFFTWLFARARRKGRLVQRFEVLGLVLFVAIPLPMTGAWTGIVAAFLFDVRKSLAIPAIFAGICIAGGVVTLAAMGVISIWGIPGGL
jgi:uncharacterized membrane protein